MNLFLQFRWILKEEGCLSVLKQPLLFINLVYPICSPVSSGSSGGHYYRTPPCIIRSVQVSGL